MSKTTLPNPEAAVFVTGATSGLGEHVAERLGAEGRHVVVAGRRSDAVECIVGRITSAGGTATGFVADLADLVDVERALQETAVPPLHGIITNAGISTDDTSATTAEGFDLTFGVNVLAHQLLLHRLSAQLVPGCRVIVVSSGVHHPANTLARRVRIPLPNWLGTETLARQQSQTGANVISSGIGRYSTSKLANVYQARALQNRLDALDLNAEVFALDPGLMVDTDLAREAPRPVRFLFRNIGRAVTPLVSNMRLSSTTAGYVSELLHSPDWAGRGFAYVDGDAIEPLGELALSADNAEELWATATRLVGVGHSDTRLNATR